MNAVILEQGETVEIYPSYGRIGIFLKKLKERYATDSLDDFDYSKSTTALILENDTIIGKEVW